MKSAYSQFPKVYVNFLLEIFLLARVNFSDAKKMMK